MLSSVLKSKKAIQVNIEIMRVFIKLRRMILSNKDLKRKIEELERKYDNNFKIVFDIIKKLIEVKDTPKRKIGFLHKK